MLKLTKPKTNNSHPGSQIYYVTSEAKPNDPPYIVVRITNILTRIFFCSCRNFMIRYLPFFGSMKFGYCKHIRFVRDVEDKAGSDVIVEAVRTTRGSR